MGDGRWDQVCCYRMGSSALLVPTFKVGMYRSATTPRHVDSSTRLAKYLHASPLGVTTLSVGTSENHNVGTSGKKTLSTTTNWDIAKKNGQLGCP